jgi:hypothetical protein
LRHFAEVGAATALPGVGPPRPRKRRRYPKGSAGPTPQDRGAAGLPQMLGHVPRAEFGSEPKGVEEGRVIRGALKACLSRVRGRGCHSGNVGAEAQLFDDLLPLPGFRQNT